MQIVPHMTFIMQTARAYVPESSSFKPLGLWFWMSVNVGEDGGWWWYTIMTAQRYWKNQRMRFDREVSVVKMPHCSDYVHGSSWYTAASIVYSLFWLASANGQTLWVPCKNNAYTVFTCWNTKDKVTKSVNQQVSQSLTNSDSTSISQSAREPVRQSLCQ